MVKIVMGLKGTGKTKTLIEMVNNAAAAEHGSVICVEKDHKLRYDISHKARLVSTADYNVNDYESFYGFVCGIIAGNFDITDIYIDSITKICGRNENMDDLTKFIAAIDKLTEHINITMTVSYDPQYAPEFIKSHVVQG